ncbi:MAG: hypothetical protein ABSB35_00725 [Bryobacteraceae bacterium]|jgi:glucan phosphoethanolaminetransferase (alkaline phosphatase superfamily)
MNVTTHMVQTVRQFLQHVVPEVVRPLHVLWNQVIGFLFAVLGILPIPSAVRTIRNFQGDGESFVRVAFSVTFAALMFYFAISSFFRARKISRS